MPNVRNIVNRALRKIGILGAGREARPNDAEDVSEALKGLYRAWIDSGAFGRLSDVVPTGDYTAGENQRIFRNSEATVTISLPQLVPAYANPLPYNRERDYYTNYEGVDGTNRPPRDGAPIVIVNAFDGQTLHYLYDGTIREWQEVSLLTLDSPAPRSVGDPEGLAACLAVEVADMFGRTLEPTTMRQVQRYEMSITSSFSRPREAAAGVFM